MTSAIPSRRRICAGIWIGGISQAAFPLTAIFSGFFHQWLLNEQSLPECILAGIAFLVK